MRENVFISYSHKDADVFAEFKSALVIGGNSTQIIWTDEQLEAADNWKAEIEKNLESARIALLLVTENFFKSTFIQNNELPTIIERANRGTLKVWWVPVEEINEESLTYVGLAPIQSAWPKKSPLATLSQAAREKAIAK